MHLHILAVLHGIDGRQSQFALPHVIAKRLAHLSRTIVKDIVAQLETDPDELAELRQTLSLSLRTAGCQSTQSGTKGKETRRLAADDVKVNGLGQHVGVLVLQLQQLTVGQRLSKLGNVANHTHIIRQRRTLQRLAQDEVTRQDSYLIGEKRIDGRQTATAVTLIHHIVVNQRSRVQHLQRQRHPNDLIIHLAYHTCSKQYEHGTQLLAGRFEQMLHHLFQQRVLTIESLAESFAKLFQFGSNRSLYLIEYFHLSHL